MFSASIKSLSVLVVVIQTVPNFQKQAIKVERMKTTAVEASVKLKAPEKERGRRERGGGREASLSTAFNYCVSAATNNQIYLMKPLDWKRRLPDISL